MSVISFSPPKPTLVDRKYYFLKYLGGDWYCCPNCRSFDVVGHTDREIGVSMCKSCDRMEIRYYYYQPQDKVAEYERRLREEEKKIRQEIFGER